MFDLLLNCCWLAAVTLQLAPDRSSIEARGEGASAGQLTVSVAGKEQLSPIAGNAVAESGVLRFKPRFPFAPGVRYQAVWRKGSESAEATIEVPRVAKTSPARVDRVFPSSAELPENQLKFYVHFSAPMSRGEAIKRIHLLDDQSREVSLPFLELEEELWDRAGQRLTVLFDPGRIKRGLVPHHEVGPALIAGREYELLIDQDWRDADGDPMAAAYRKRFRVIPADREPPTPSNWRISAVAAGSRDALVIDFPEPLDAALLERLIWVDGMDGRAEIGSEERQWRFTPSLSWSKSAKYQLMVGALLEDLAGNRIERKFDVDTFERVEMRLKQDRRALPITVR